MENLNEIFEVLNERVCIYMKQKIDEKLKDFPPLMRYWRGCTICLSNSTSLSPCPINSLFKAKRLHHMMGYDVHHNDVSFQEAFLINSIIVGGSISISYIILAAYDSLI